MFEPLDQTTMDILTEDVVRIINFDPRVSLIDLQVYPNFDTGEVQVHVKLHFIEFDIVDNMDLNIVFEG